MKASCTKPVLVTCTILLLLIVAQESRVAAVEQCNPMQLMPCKDAILNGSNPSNICCAKLKEQQHCVCQYMRNPNFKSFFNSPNAKMVATHCQCQPKC
ncbi:unnamed protein product [Eruca vesicaria subsp. sativa]|uniref:Bifunctional inhibitor/plant lipid transfer protein/seed storage helical domain-containing protein n=1 Tax=Eruca vesicaria subsp. sativa TaxID=29727 RepID=A0ABC8KSZ4_ERUVS|nr:unnamed protein product [Eruca vesicaria subsp. sativa]